MHASLSEALLAWDCLVNLPTDVGARVSGDIFDSRSRKGQVDHMITATISDTKNRLGELLERVQAGESLLILDRKTPVARVERVCNANDNPHLVPSREKWNPTEILAHPIMAARKGTLVKAVDEERASGW